MLLGVCMPCRCVCEAACLHALPQDLVLRKRVPADTLEGGAQESVRCTLEKRKCEYVVCEVMWDYNLDTKWTDAVAPSLGLKWMVIMRKTTSFQVYVAYLKTS